MDGEEQHDSYREAIDRLAAGYNKSVVLAAVTTSSLSIIDDSITGVESSLSQIVAAFEEIRATSRSTADNAARVDGMMEEILSKNGAMDKDVSARMGEVEGAASKARAIGELFRGLQSKTRSIEEVTGSIRDVSDRTNILAINASIEAARAGGVGKGFRIIANEVRSLAGRTGEFARQIDETTAEFRSSVAEIDGSMRAFLELLESFRASFAEVLASFKENASSINEAGRFLTEISGSIREETQALADGLDSLEAVSTSMKDSHAVFGALNRSHAFLDELLERH